MHNHADPRALWSVWILAGLVVWSQLGPDSARHIRDAAPPAGGRVVETGSGQILEIRSRGVELSYDITEIRARAGQTLTIRYDNSESEMAHNIVLVRSEEDIKPVGVAALRAYDQDFIPPQEMHRILAHSRVAYPGDTIEFSFQVPPPGSYPYICTYSGHYTMMQGRLISTE